MIRKIFAALAIGIITIAGVSTSNAQNRAMGAQSFILDDGIGHTITIQINGTLSGSFVYNIPVPPVGNPPAGFVNVGTATGQLLYWNAAAGHNDWETVAAGASNTLLHGNGAAAPSFSAVNLNSADVTSILPINNGGTGANSVATNNLVFAGPAAGAPGAPSFRVLVGSDIPAGSASYIQNQNAGAQAAANFWISGNGRLGGNLTVDGTSTLTGAATANNFASSGATITGGSINSTPVGAGTASTGAFTTLSSTGALSVAGTGSETFANLNTLGVVHNSATGALSTSLVSLTADVNGILPIANGGSGANSVASNNLVFAGPASGAPSAPSFRALAASDIPAGSGNYIQNQTGVAQAGAGFNTSGSGAVGSGFNVAGGVLNMGGTQVIDASRNLTNITTLNLVAPTAGGNGTISINGTRVFNVFSATAGGSSANLFVGGGAGNLTMTGFLNVGIGPGALASDAAGGENTAVGSSAMNALTSGFHNTAVGSGAMSFHEPGSQNTAVGEYALTSLNNSGVNANNVGIGYQAGNNITTGTNNTALGTNSGQAIVAGLNNTFVGNSANASGDLTNAMALGSGATVGANNTIQLGNSSVTSVTTSGAYNTTTGYEISGVAASGNYLRGNGTNFVSSAILAGDVPTGSANYIQNQNAGAQAAASFWISGNGRLGGNLTVDGTSTLTGAATANNFASSGATITGGSINSTPVGAGTASTGAFTTLASTGASTIATGAGTTNTFGNNAATQNSVGNGSTLNFFGETATTNRFGLAATTNNFGGTAVASPQANNFGNTSAATTVTNTIGTAAAGGTANTTIGGGGGTTTVAITSGNWSVNAAGAVSGTSGAFTGAVTGGSGAFTGALSGNTLSIAAGKMAVDANGNITKINNVTTSWPAAQGGATTVLTNDGSGNLSWASGFSLPYSATVSNAGTLLSITNSGAGDAIDASAGTGAAVQATGNVVIKSPNATPSKLTLQTPSNGANTTSFQTQAQPGGSITYTLPAAIPTAGEQLAVSGVAGTTATLTWQASGAAPAFTQTAVTGGSTYTAAVTDNFLSISGTGGTTTINLPSSAGAGGGHTIIIKDAALALSGSHTITVNATGTDSFEDETSETFVTSSNYSTSLGYNVGFSLRLYSDGAGKWLVW
jgi:hypothetical protein